MDDEKERERAFKRERDAVEAWKTGPVEEPPETIAPEQAAWAAYVASRYLNRDQMQPAHHAFLAGYRLGWSEGLNAAGRQT